MSIVVVGANGFIGRSLALALVEAQHDVMALSCRVPDIVGADCRSVDVADERWLVVRRDPGALVLRAVRWLPGEAWLGYGCDEHELVEVGSLRPKGVPGFLYWMLLRPVHRCVSDALARRRVESAT